MRSRLVLAAAAVLLAVTPLVRPPFMAGGHSAGSLR